MDELCIHIYRPDMVSFEEILGIISYILSTEDYTTMQELN